MIPARTRAGLARAGLALASLGLVLGSLEIGLRLTWTRPWWEQLRGQEPEWSYRRYDVAGMPLILRAEPTATPAPEGVYRILFLGDSFTFASSVEEASGFVHRIGVRLNEERPRADVERYEVWNGGIPGSLTFQWSALLEAFGPGFEPDLVVAVFFVRDGVAGVHTTTQIDEIRREMVRLSLESRAYRHSYLVRWLRARLEQRRLSERYLARLREGYFGPEASRVEWQRAQQELLWMRGESRRLGAGFALVVFPMLYELGRDHPLADVCAEIERFARQADIPVLSLLPAFLGRHAPDLWVSAHDQHPNAEGHRIAAEALYPFVAGQVRASPRAQARPGAPP